jgi:hypothetical protein
MGAAPAPHPHELLLVKAVADDRFRRRLVDDPEAACESEHIQVEPELMQQLKGLSKEERQRRLDTVSSNLPMAQAYMDSKGL